MGYCGIMWNLYQKIYNEKNTSKCLCFFVLVGHQGLEPRTNRL